MGKQFRMKPKASKRQYRSHKNGTSNDTRNTPSRKSVNAQEPIFAGFSVYQLRSKLSLLMHSIHKDKEECIRLRDERIAQNKKYPKPDRHKTFCVRLNQPHLAIWAEAEPQLKSHGFNQQELYELKLTMFLQIATFMANILGRM